MRRLGDQGLTPQQMLLDRTREHLPGSTCADPALSVCEVAMMLGYSDQSAFTKAFEALDGRYASGLAHARGRDRCKSSPDRAMTFAPMWRVNRESPGMWGNSTGRDALFCLAQALACPPSRLSLPRQIVHGALSA